MKKYNRVHESETDQRLSICYPNIVIQMVKFLLREAVTNNCGVIV